MSNKCPEFETLSGLPIHCANNFTEAYIRPIVYLDTEPWVVGARTTLSDSVIATREWAYIWGKKVSQKAFLWVQVHYLPSCQCKLTAGKDYRPLCQLYSARYEANENGYEEAIMLDHWICGRRDRRKLVCHSGRQSQNTSRCEHTRRNHPTNDH